MRLLVTGGAGFIGSNFVRYWVRAPSRRRRGGLRRAHLRRQPAQPGRRRGPDRVRPGRHRRPRGRGQDAGRAPDRRDRQLRRRVAQQPGHPRPGPLLPHQRARHPDPGRGGPPSRRVALPPHLHLRGLRRPPPRLRRGVHRGDPVPAPDPVQRLEGRRRPRRAGLRRRPSGCRPPSPTAATTTARTSSPKRSSRCSPPRPSTTSRCRCTPRPRTGASGCTSTTTAGPSSWCSSTARWGRPTTWGAGSRPASRRSPTPCSTPPAGPQSLKEIVPDRPEPRPALPARLVQDPTGIWAGSRRCPSPRAWPTPWPGTRPTGAGGSRCVTGPRWSRGRGRPSRPPGSPPGS